MGSLNPFPSLPFPSLLFIPFFLFLFTSSLFFVGAEAWTSGLPADRKAGEAYPHRPLNADAEFDCMARDFVWQYAQKLQPWRPNIRTVYDALQLATLCNQSAESSTVRTPLPNIQHKVRAGQFFVNCLTGNDANSGSLSAPFKTIQHAVDVAKSDATIYLREGICYLSSPVNLGPENSGLTFMNYNHEEVQINGGIPLQTKWTPYNLKNGANIYVADLSGQAITQITGLQLNGTRCTRARYPNANPEVDIFPVGYIPTAHKWMAPHSYPAAQTYTLASPIRSTGVAFQQFTIGTGGACSVFDPPQSYWCSSNRNGGGASSYEVPSGLVFENTTFNGRIWKNATGGLVHAFQNGHWENWMFEIDAYDPENYTIGWHLGGFQGARGSKKGGEWFVENIFEELDAPNEFYYDGPNQQLYYFHNGTGSPPAESVFVAANIKVLFNITGSQQAPVTDIQINGLTFQNTAYTYMDPHGVPSGGDWSLQRTGALFFEGTEQVSISQCLFIRLDGIALFLSGYNRNTTISQNEFVWIGDSAMASWGYTADNHVNGTEGDFPRYTRVLYNFVHEHGLYTKQSSAWIQAKSAQSYFERNIFFNGPRAAVNINDGFGGGNEFYMNLMFNQVRETSDHGPINSWDREPFWTTVANPTGSFTQLYNQVHHNVFLCNYGSQACIDNDDGSTYFKNFNNFEIYGCHKDYFAGHNKYTYDSVLAFPVCWNHGCAFFTDFVEGYIDGLYNVSCILGSDSLYIDYYSTQYSLEKFNASLLPYVTNNRVYSSASVMVSLNNTLYPLSAWQTKGQDPGTVILAVPSNEDIISMGKEIVAVQ